MGVSYFAPYIPSPEGQGFTAHKIRKEFFMTDWKKVQGSQEEKPAAFDTKTSAFVVYQRRNVKRIT